MDERYRRDANRFCRGQRAQEVKVGHDDISRSAREFFADMVGPDRSSQKAPGEEGVDPESLRCPSPEEAKGGGETSERVLGRVQGDECRPNGPDAIEEGGTGGARRTVRL
jgi:hypothetical protein